MGRYKDISCQKFGRLTALYRIHNIKGYTKWLCVCECGKFTESNISNLLRGRICSCGCLQKEMARKANVKHCKSNTHLYYVWRSIKYRCYNKNTKAFKNYGARGIAVCDEWLHDFQAFYEWSMSHGYNDTLTIDRIDNNGDYEPSNCRWITMKQQARNRRTNVNYTINGETHCVMDWCKILGLNYKTVYARIKRGWSIERAFEL